MSHFTVTVCLDGSDPHLVQATQVASQGFPLHKIIKAHLDHVLAPFDENREAEPYRNYEEGDPEDYWWVSSVRRGAESWRQLQDKGAAVLAAERIARFTTRPARDADIATQAVNEHAREWEADHAWATKLGERPSWADVAALYSECYGESEDRILTDDTGRAYTMSTYNPQSKWDWWVIGGRWPARFSYRKGHENEIISSGPHWAWPDEVLPAMHCDGGPLRALDLNKTREEAAARAREDYAKYLTAVARTPEALPWSVFTDNISEGNGYDAEQARTEYNSQPRIKALRDSSDFTWASNEDFQVPEALYAERARAGAVPGYATLTADGRWMAPGKMSWFGMRTAGEGDRTGYLEAANAYIGSLPGDSWLISVDCHI